jgi:hypothetical protein
LQKQTVSTLKLQWVSFKGDLESAIGSNVSVPVSLYLRLVLELLQNHHDSMYEIRDEISEFEESVATIEAVPMPFKLVHQIG